MYLILDHDEKLIGRSHIILKQGKFIKKYYPMCHVETAEGGDIHFVESVKKTTSLMKLVHPDLYVGEETTDDFYCVTQNFIDYNPCKNFGYTHNIRCYLKLIEKLGYDYSKRDLQYYNLLYRKSDDKPFCIDWDAYATFKDEETAYKHYKTELVSYKWQRYYNTSAEDLSVIFEREWNNV
jgi:hypothetical protein